MIWSDNRYLNTICASKNFTQHFVDLLLCWTEVGIPLKNWQEYHNKIQDSYLKTHHIKIIFFYLSFVAAGRSVHETRAPEIQDTPDKQLDWAPWVAVWSSCWGNQKRLQKAQHLNTLLSHSFCYSMNWAVTIGTDCNQLDVLSIWASSFPRKSTLKIFLMISSGKVSAIARMYVRKISWCGSRQSENTEAPVRDSLKEWKRLCWLIHLPVWGVKRWIHAWSTSSAFAES